MKRTILAISALLLYLVAWGQTAGTREEDEALLRGWIKTISSDEFGGRKPMTEYEDKTVGYLAGELEKLGLEPAFDGSWYQPFNMIAVTAKPVGNKFTVRGKKKAVLNYPEDFVAWTARATDKVSIPKAEYVFCGFGISAPEYGWDDYDGIDVRGKIVIAMVNDPGYYNPALFRGHNMTYYGRWLYKFEEAKRRGAAGCLVLHNTEAASYGWHVCVNGHMEDNLAIYDPETGNAGDLAVKGWLREEGASKLFAAAGMDMEKAIAAAKKPGFRSFPLKVKGDVKMVVTYTVRETRNVGGILCGSDRPEEAIVLNAHWDHLGMGTPDETGDVIYNGAADNASGMAGALLAAKKFTSLSRKPRRSVLFLFPSSEESGLFGSEYYCAHPAIPMEKTVACLNFESIGPAELTRDVVILGGGESFLDDYYVAAAAAQGRYIFFDDDNSDGWFFRSDHYNFVKKGVPAVVVENGLNPADPAKPNKYPMPVWYHKPSDEYREDWDLTGTLENIYLIYSVGLSLSFMKNTSPQEPASKVSFDDVITSRRSIRSYDPSKTISEEEVRALLKATQEAPSWANQQPAKYYVAIGEEKRQAIRQLFSIPENETVMAVISLGYRAGEPVRPSRRDLDEIAKFL